MERRGYGLAMLAVIAGIALYSLWETYSGVWKPGLFYRFQDEVWCATTLTIQPVDSGPQRSTFWHYPGKSTEKVVSAFVNHVGLRATFTNEDITESEGKCYASWQEAAEDNPLFRSAAEGYQPMLADWTEADYEEAVLYTVMGEGNRRQTAAEEYVAHRALEFEEVNPPTPVPMTEMEGVFCTTEGVDSEGSVMSLVHPPGDRAMVETMYEEIGFDMTIIRSLEFADTKCKEDWRSAYYGLSLSNRVYADFYLPGELKDKQHVPSEAQYRDIVLEAILLDRRPSIEHWFPTVESEGGEEAD